MNYKILLTVAAFLFSLSNSVWGQDKVPTLEEMWKIIQQQQAEIESLKQQLGAAQSRVEEIDVKVVATADAMEQGGQSTSVGTSASWAEKTQLGGYGEHHFNHVEDGDDQVDAHRFVTYIGHQFNDKVSFFSELELEHSLAGDGAPGEMELEQAYIQWDFAQNHKVQIGQFLLPVGIINETHEPDTFYGTERNKVESEVIPATWWEAGAMVIGELAPGLSYNAAIHSGLSTDNFRIRSGRQKNAEAKAEDLAFTGRLKYTGLPGLEIATTVQLQQDIAQGAFAEDASATLMEAHVAYRTGKFGINALWADWEIDGADFELADAGSLSGWYIEPSYRLLENLGVFLRYSEYERGDRITTDYESYDFGINFWLHPQVVLKADYTDTVGDGDEGDAFNLGVGWSF